MIVRVLPRQGGKTTEMIRLAAEEGLYIVCATFAEAGRVHREAHEAGMDIPMPVTWDDFVNRRYYPPGVKGFLIDNLDLCVQSMTRVPVRAVTLTGEAEVTAPPNPWIPADPDGLPPETYPSWRAQEKARRG